MLYRRKTKERSFNYKRICKKRIKFNMRKEYNNGLKIIVLFSHIAKKLNSQNQQLVINRDQFIEKGFHRNLTVMKIEEDLSRMNARNIDVKEELQQRCEAKGMIMQIKS
ncbi:hypothetical protein B4918_31635 (plasmid) [Bacillus thuringiensis]|uniref:Uncharacterized protein n=1 Tax=Bacillus thuringiensis TaxID=1428 RepID=A0A9W3TJR3_BACTU|nr:hypothetical protein B4918_31635 [Bacillus thuringiensis]